VIGPHEQAGCLRPVRATTENAVAKAASEPERETRRLIARLQALGHIVTINPAA
jgi:hypothetical protein